MSEEYNDVIEETSTRNSKWQVMHPVKFGHNGDDFAAAVKQRVEDYFKKNGISRKANALMIFKTVLFVFLFISSYYVAVFSNAEPWQRLLAGILFGCDMAFLAFNIGHDASHNAYSSSKKVNHILGYTMNLVGINQYIWNIKHNLSHHTFTNVPYADMDNENVGVARLTRHHKWKPIFQYQHIYLPLLWPFFGLFLMLVKDFQLFNMKRMGNTQYPEGHPLKEWVILFFSKAITFSYLFALPLIFIPLPWYQILFGILLTYMCMGILLTSFFLFVHLIDTTPFPEEDSTGHLEDNWILHQMKVTVDYSPFNPVITFFSGALNQHVAHHTFPNICHVHYGAITRIIQKTAKEYGYQYRYQGFFAAMASHIRFLKKMGQKPA
ncbi:MAG: acyl-CoA desaturase [Bacteroidetes bacterium]|nr:MAG: acyl-CoA desaturase [Bacteroidota bacterium]